jgi:NitT/TauT family transport system ATP-binding protein
MDEPFQGLDLPLKFQLIRSFEDARERDPKTTLFVTHDMEEALLLGDEIYVLSRPPAVVRLAISHPVSRGERYPGHEGFSALERALFEALRG